MSLSSRSPALVLLSLLASSLVVACATEQTKEDNPGDWSCEQTAVPMGGVVRCTAEGSGTAAPARAPAPSGGESSTVIRTYGTPPSSDGSSSDTDAGAADTSDTSDAGASSSDESSSSTSTYACTDGSSDCPSHGAAGDLTPSASTDECTYAPELPQCSGGADGSSAPPPAKGPWHCTKDMATGQKVCESPPACAPGTHAGACGACIEDGTTDDCVPPSDGGCWVTGGGFIVPQTEHANFGGNAKQMKKGGVQGHWNHVDHASMNHLNGRPSYIFCRHVDEPGPGGPGAHKGFDKNQIYFGGEAKWGPGGGADGFWFDVVAKDHGEPGSQPSPKNGGMVDTYHITVRRMDDPTNQVAGAIVYEAKGGLVGGNIQMHPPNGGHPGVQSPLPQWVSLEP